MEEIPSRQALEIGSMRRIDEYAVDDLPRGLERAVFSIERVRAAPGSRTDGNDRSLPAVPVPEDHLADERSVIEKRLSELVAVLVIPRADPVRLPVYESSLEPWRARTIS